MRRVKKVAVLGEVYPHQAAAAKAIGCSQQAVGKAIKNNRLDELIAKFQRKKAKEPDRPVPTWIETIDGQPFDLLAVDPQISLRALVWGCARQPRYAGQWREDVEFYSVAEHSLLMWRYAKNKIPRDTQHTRETRRFLRTVLCHDLAEGILCDIPTPLKKMLPDYGRLEDSLYSSLARRFDLLDPIPDEVKLIDMRILRDETEQLLTERPARWEEWGMPADIKRLGVRTIQMRPQVAAKTFAWALASAGVVDRA